MSDPQNEKLVQILLSRIRAEGRIPFSDFMDLVLYHPQEGYYRSSPEKIGPAGDYYTSPHIHPVFGILLSGQINQMWELLGRPPEFTLVEMGAGKGLLCSDILGSCQERWPHLYQALTYILAESNQALRKDQSSLLSPFLQDGKVTWFPAEDLLRGERPFTGCLLSNELIDAFPVHLVEQAGDGLLEIYVTERNGSFEETPGPPSSPLLGEYLGSYGSPLADGQRAEVNLRALEWLEGVNRALRRGVILTIDYGFEADELYDPQRSEGTLLCYFRHTTSPDPYRRIGYQDMTAHVNFTALIRKGEELGLKMAGFTEQYKFLVALGLLEELEQGEESADSSSPAFWREKLAMRNFLIPGGMGRLFKVLAQSKGMPEAALRGFQDPFSPARKNP